jgi:hypothetical protein
MVRAETGEWSTAAVTFAAASLLSQVTQLECYIDSAGTPYVYGVVPPFVAPESAQFFVLYFDHANAVWDVLYQVQALTLNTAAPVTFHIVGGAAGSAEVLWIDQQNIRWQPAMIVPPSRGGFAWQGSLEILAFGDVALNVSRIITFPGASTVDLVLIVDDANTLWYAQFLSGQNFPILIPLTGIPSAPGGAADVGINADHALFVVEADTRRLWISRSYGQSPVWVNLGNRVEALAVPPTNGTELFITDLTGRVFHLAQVGHDPADTIWVTRKLAAPGPGAGKPKRISSIAMEAAAVDARGGPVSGALFTVASDQWVISLSTGCPTGRVPAPRPPFPGMRRGA